MNNSLNMLPRNIILIFIFSVVLFHVGNSQLDIGCDFFANYDNGRTSSTNNHIAKKMTTTLSFFPSVTLNRKNGLSYQVGFHWKSYQIGFAFKNAQQVYSVYDGSIYEVPVFIMYKFHHNERFAFHPKIGFKVGVANKGYSGTISSEAPVKYTQINTGFTKMAFSLPIFVTESFRLTKRLQASMTVGYNIGLNTLSTTEIDYYMDNQKYSGTVFNTNSYFQMGFGVSYLFGNSFKKEVKAN